MTSDSRTPASTSIDGTPRSVVKSDPPHASDADVARIGEGVQAGTHPYEHWTHLAHCAATICLLRERGLDRLTHEMPAIIRRYNETVGVKNTPTAGYHETLTQFYLRAVANLLATLPSETGLAECVAALKASPLAERDYVFGFYSRDRLFTATARAGWVEPDLKPLPF